jgi:hypothetical protein
METNTTATAATAVDTNTATQATPATQETQAAAVAEAIQELGDADLKKIAKFKVDGKEEKLPLAEIIKRAQKGTAAEKRMEQATLLERRIQQINQMAQDNPREYLRMLGHDLDKLADEAVQEQIKRRQMTEEQRREADLKAELESERKEKLKLKKMEEDRAKTWRQQQVEGAIGEEYSKALQELKFPKNSYLVQRAAAEQIRSIKRGEPLSAKQALVKIKEEFNDTVRGTIQDVLSGDSPADAIRQLLSEPVVKLILESEVRRVKSGTSPTVNSVARPGAGPVPSEKKSKAKPMNEREWRVWQESLKQ